MQLATIDVIVLVILGISSILGFMRGAIASVLDLFSALAILILSSVLFSHLQHNFEPYIESEIVLNIVIGIVSLFICWIVITVLSNQLLNLLSLLNKGVINRILGLAIGFAKGVVYSSLLMLGTAIIASSSYVGAQNAYELIEHINAEKLPSWFIRSNVYNIASAKISSNSPLFNQENYRGWLEEIDITIGEQSSQALGDEGKKLLEDAKDKIKQKTSPELNDSLDSLLEKDTKQKN